MDCRVSDRYVLISGQIIPASYRHAGVVETGYIDVIDSDSVEFDVAWRIGIEKDTAAVIRAHAGPAKLMLEIR